MIQHLRPIAPPPSLDEILSNQGRIGRVDFSQRLVPVAEPDPGEADATAGAPSSSHAAAAQVPTAPSMADLIDQPDETAQVGEAAEDPDEQPAQPAPADETISIDDDADRSGAAGEPDRGDVQGEDPEQVESLLTSVAPHPSDVPSEPEGSEPEVVEPQRSAPQPSASQPTASQPTASQPTASQPTASQPTASQPTASQPTASQPTASQPFERAPGSTGAEQGQLPRRQQAAQVTHLLSLVPSDDVPAVTRDIDDIDDVVGGVIARIREAQHATLVHLEAIEAEAALRCEMLTAQAELDAELIRLHARREAHAIIAAARQRAGVAQPRQADEERRRLDQLGEAAMRLAEELEALGDDPSPDHPFLR